MALWVGAILALVVGLTTTGVGMDRDRAFYPTVMNPGVPMWWPEFCATYDVVAAAYLAWLLRSGRVRAAAT